jgi:CheY-like chemotaxis protein
MKILLVDDDLHAMEWLRTILEQDGHSLDQVFSVREAMAKFEEAFKHRSWAYDLMILDIQILEDRDAAGEMKREEMLKVGVTLHDAFRLRFPTEKVMILTNLMYRVPEELHESRDTITRDKADVVRDLGSFVDEVHRFVGES